MVWDANRLSETGWHRFDFLFLQGVAAPSSLGNIVERLSHSYRSPAPQGPGGGKRCHHVLAVLQSKKVVIGRSAKSISSAGGPGPTRIRSRPLRANERAKSPRSARFYYPDPPPRSPPLPDPSDHGDC